MSDSYALSVSKIKKETPQSVSVTFAVPDHLKERFSFKAGQYITIKHSHQGQEIRRAYSLCSTPHSGLLTVGIKKVPSGIFSVYANELLKEGDQLEVMPPEGRFVLEPSTQTKNYAAFAAGSGITPILSMITTALEKENDSRFLLVYGNRSVEETMFYQDLENLKQRFGTRLMTSYLFSRKKAPNALFGRIENASVNYLLKNPYGEIAFDHYYLCGPETMIDTVTQTLVNRGAQKEDIQFELFTSTEEDPPEAAPAEGSTQITVTVDDETDTFVMDTKKSILDACLDQGLDAPYSCQGGICSTCIARITEGTAEMRKNQILTDGEVAEGLVLTCQAHPTSAAITVDYDDV